LLLAIVLASGLCEDFHEATPQEIRQTGKGVCLVKRRGLSQPIVREFTREMAELAGLWKKAGPWTQYPYRMLQMRARSWALRDAFTDVLKGLRAYEEAVDSVDLAPEAHGSWSLPQIPTPGNGEHESSPLPEAAPAPTEAAAETKVLGKGELLQQIYAKLAALVPGDPEDAVVATDRQAIVAHCFGTGIVNRAMLSGLPINALRLGWEALQTWQKEEPPDSDTPGQAPASDDGVSSGYVSFPATGRSV
jgi:hypothetical protein